MRRYASLLGTQVKLELGASDKDDPNLRVSNPVQEGVATDAERVPTEQRNALEIIASQQFRRPLIKTMRKNFGEGVTLYAGRKGFVDLMLSKKQAFENISVWMGHSTLQRTWESYKNRRRFHLNDF